MLNQEVGVNVWKMVKAMLTYAAVSLVGWVVLRLFTTMLTMPRRLRSQQDRIQQSLAELQRRYPDLEFSEEELKNAQKEFEEEREKREMAQTAENTDKPVEEDNKKTK